MWKPRSRPRSEGVGRDDFVAADRRQGVVDLGPDALLHEPDRAVAHAEVGPAGVIALEAVVVGLVPPAVLVVEGAEQLNPAGWGSRWYSQESETGGIEKGKTTRVRN